MHERHRQALIDVARLQQAGPGGNLIRLPVTSAALRTAGLTARDVATLVEHGELRRLRKGWFAEPTAHGDVCDAVALGGTLTCVSALVAHGGWCIGDRRLHLRLPESRAAAPAPATRTVVRHGSRGRSLPSPASIGIDDPYSALRCASRCLGDDELLIVADAARQRRLIEPAAYERLIDSLPPGEAQRLRLSSPGSGSGSETRVRLLFQRRGIEVVPQFGFGHGEFADLLVDGWLVIECDSIVHHASTSTFLNDRRRTLELQRDGYHVIRLTYADVWERWEATSLFLLEVVRLGRRAIRQPARRRRRAASQWGPA